MSEVDRALRDFAQLFERLELAYAVMGGLAVRVYSIPRATLDVDMTVAIDRDRLDVLYDEVRALGYTVPEEYTRGWVDTVGGMPLVRARMYLGARGVDVDLFLAESAFQRQLLARRRSAQVDELTVYVVSPEDLILLKLIAGRPRDLADVGDILFTQGQLDESYMHRWARDLGVLPALERILTEPPPG